MKTLPENILRRMSPEDRAPLGKGFKTSAEAREVCDARSEKELQRLCEAYARQHSIPFFRQRMDRKSNMPIGTPDAFICLRGAFLAVEFKVGTNGLTPEQSACLMDIQKNGGRIYVIRKFEDFVSVLKATESSIPTSKVPRE